MLGVPDPLPAGSSSKAGAACRLRWKTRKMCELSLHSIDLIKHSSSWSSTCFCCLVTSFLVMCVMCVMRSRVAEGAKQEEALKKMRWQLAIEAGRARASPGSLLPLDDERETPAIEGPPLELEEGALPGCLAVDPRLFTTHSTKPHLPFIGYGYPLVVQGSQGKAVLQRCRRRRRRRPYPRSGATRARL